MKKLILVLLVSLLAVPVSAQMAFIEGEQCDGTVDAARGCLEVEASLTAFIALRDALTPDWANSPTCGDCGVNLGISICTDREDPWTLTRKQLALARLNCQLRSVIIQAELVNARASADAGVDRTPDVGGGDPQ